MRNLRQLRPTSDRQIEYYCKGLPYLDETRIKGRLIVIEGPDASGRSTQIMRITSKLEADGHGCSKYGRFLDDWDKGKYINDTNAQIRYPQYTI